MMKRFGKKLLSLVLAAVMLCGALPAALAVDTEPPLYEQFSCASPEEFIQTYGAGRWDYDTFADRCRQHYEAILADPQIALDYYGYASLKNWIRTSLSGRLGETARSFIETRRSA